MYSFEIDALLNSENGRGGGGGGGGGNIGSVTLFLLAKPTLISAACTCI